MATSKYIVRKGFNISLPDLDPKRGNNRNYYEDEVILLTESEYQLVAHQVEAVEPEVPPNKSKDAIA